MTRRLVIQEMAEVDITQAALWYESQRAGLGSEFITDIEACIERVVANPRHHRRLRRIPEVRRIISKRFPYRLFYVLKPDAVIVFRLLHGARRDREWTQSIPSE